MSQNQVDQIDQIQDKNINVNVNININNNLLPKSHMEIGRDLKLFFFDEVSPGSAFFLPHGSTLMNNLINFMKKLYKKYNYKEVSTPVLCDKQLWITSGHYDKYKENMFHIANSHHLLTSLTTSVIFSKSDSEESNKSNEFSMCPMNCPKHAIMYKHMNPSYRDLPLRLADFGVLHRNELSGALTSLTRNRMFRQDDSHVFCRKNQIHSEISTILDILDSVYKIFNLEYELCISTRPDNFIGSVEIWDETEEILKNCVQERCNLLNKQLTINEGDGAFYGPKIDIHVKDSFNRKHQLGTIQLDFNLPQRFGLKYRTEHCVSNVNISELEKENENEDKDKDKDKKTYDVPVMIHKAIYGSLERFIAVILENSGGHLPFIFSPRQICILPVSNKHCEYATEVHNMIQSYFQDVNCDIINDGTLSKRILEVELLKYNFVLVVGNKEMKNKSVNVRHQNVLNQNNCEGEISNNDFLEVIKSQIY